MFKIISTHIYEFSKNMSYFSNGEEPPKRPEARIRELVVYEKVPVNCRHPVSGVSSNSMVMVVMVHGEVHGDMKLGKFHRDLTS